MGIYSPENPSVPGNQSPEDEEEEEGEEDGEEEEGRSGIRSSWHLERTPHLDRD